MFGEKTPEEIRELYTNTTSRMIIKLVTFAAQEHLKFLRAQQIDSAMRGIFSEKRNAFFSSAYTVEQECWESTDFTESYKQIIISIADDRTLQEAIVTLESWINSAKEYGF